MESARNGSTPAPEANNFEAWAKKLKDTHNEAVEKADVKEPRRPRKQPINVFKLAAYEYMWLLERRDLSQELNQFLDQRDGRGWRRNSDDVATAVLRLVIGGKQTDKMRQIGSRTAFGLRLAWLNQVRPELLIGFLHEAGNEQIIKEDVRREKRYAWAKHYSTP